MVYICLNYVLNVPKSRNGSGFLWVKQLAYYATNWSSLLYQSTWPVIDISLTVMRERQWRVLAEYIDMRDKTVILQCFLLSRVARAIMIYMYIYGKNIHRNNKLKTLTDFNWTKTEALCLNSPHVHSKTRTRTPWLATKNIHWNKKKS